MEVTEHSREVTSSAGMGSSRMGAVVEGTGDNSSKAMEEGEGEVGMGMVAVAVGGGTSLEENVGGRRECTMYMCVRYPLLHRKMSKYGGEKGIYVDGRPAVICGLLLA